MNKEEVINRIESLKEEMRSLVDTAKAESRDLSEDEKSLFTEKEQMVRDLNSSLETIDKKETKINERSKMKKTYLKCLAQQVSDVVNNRDLGSYENLTGNTINLRDDAYTNVTDGDVTDIQALEYTRIITPLEKQVIFDKLGLTFINTGSLVKMPSCTSVACSLNGENTKLESQKITFDNKPITPARIGVAVGLSNTAVKTVENNVNLLAYALKAMREAEGRLINRMIISPVAVSNDGVTVKGPFVDLLAGDASVAQVANWENIIALETAVKEKNAMITDRAAFVMAPATADKLRSKPVALKGNNKIAGFVMEDGKIDGIPVYQTNECNKYDASGNLEYSYIGFCADWSTVIVQSVGAPDLIIDPYTKAKENEIELVLNDNLGFNWERSANFSVMKLDASSFVA